MAYKLTGINNHAILQAAIKSYDCSSSTDIGLLPKFGKKGTQILNDGYDETNNAPCGYGSTALVIADGNTTVYKLMPDNEWRAL